MRSSSIRRLRGEAREAHARGALGRFAASGSRKAAFCRAEGISTVTLGRWQKEFGRSARSPGGAAFVEVRLDRDATGGGFELELSTGRRLKIPRGFDAGDLERLLAALGRTTC